MALRTAAVLGASGHLGSALSRALVARGARVTGIVRRTVLSPSLEGVALCVRPLDEDASLLPIAAEHEVLIDAAAPYPLRLHASPGDLPPAELAHRHARRVLEPVERAGVRLLHLGSWVSAAPARDDLTSRYARRTHPYFEVKARLEDALLDAAARGLPVSVATVTMATGPWDTKPRPLCLIPQLVAGEHPLVPDAQLDLIDVRDVAALVLALLDRGAPPAHVPLVGHTVRFPEAAARLAHLAGVPPPRGTIPSEAAVLALTAWETMSASGQVPAGPPALGMMLIHEMVPGLRAPVQAELGVPLRPLDATLADALAWYRTLGYCSPRPAPLAPAMHRPRA